MSAAVSAAVSPERSLPPVIGVGCGALVLAIAGVIDLSAYLPGHPSLVVPICLLAAAALAVLGNILSLGRVGDFAWWMFWTVWRWAMLGYAVIAGMLMYIFVYDSIPAGPLTLLLLTLAVFAVNIPVMLGFSVARFQPPSRPVP